MEKIKLMIDLLIAADTLASRHAAGQSLLSAIEQELAVNLSEAREHLAKVTAPAPTPDPEPVAALPLASLQAAHESLKDAASEVPHFPDTLQE